MDNLTKVFFQYLENLSISKKSLKNYKSDFFHFLGWAELRLRSFGVLVNNLVEVSPFLSHSLATEYKDYLEQNNIRTRTINRRLSTLRHLGKFMASQGITDINFSDKLENVPLVEKKKYEFESLVSGFTNHLVSEGATKSTLKNYVSDIKHFLSWLQKKSEDSFKANNSN